MRYVPFAILIILIILIVIANIFLIAVNQNLKNDLGLKDTEFNNRVTQLRDFIKRDLNEKYKIDIVSSEGIYKKLEEEKKRSRELEEKIKR